MDITPFKGFISSLSHLTGLRFEIWNGSGSVFASGVERARMMNPEQIQNLCDRIIRNQGFQHILSEDGSVAFGVPIQNGDTIGASLIAHDPGEQTPWAAMGPTSPPRSHFKEIAIFLTYLAGLIEDKWKSQKEVEEMADELDRSFSDLYLYSRISTQLRTLKFSGNMLKNLIEDLLDTMRVDLSFAELRNRKEYDVLACKPEIAQKIPDHKVFIEGLIQAIPADAASLEEHYFAISDSKTTPGFAELHPEPFRFLAVKLKHNRVFYGWLGMVSFNLKEIFRRSELSLMGMMAEQIAVADTFDAITSSRAYRSAKPEEEALAIIDEVAGTQLDPILVQAFKAALHKHPKCSAKERG